MDGIARLFNGKNRRVQAVKDKNGFTKEIEKKKRSPPLGDIAFGEQIFLLLFFLLEVSE